jgi:aspartyl-tRNA(Asn)/glutamyl-tRNA(Gln) amidotransferase subunit A
LVNAFLNVDRERALAQARAVDDKRRRGERVGKLGGLPVAIKDVICTKGEPTTCASRMLKNFVPPYDAHVITRLREADAVLIGRTNMDEFAMGSSTENSAFQTTRNPWNLERTPGGSSGGSAAAVAASMAPLALGSDTGGSIRQPAGFCGVVGMKPTYGRVSRFGLVAYASSLDQIGPFANDVAGAALVLEAIAGHDRRDSTSVDSAVPEYSLTVEEPLTGLKIGIAKEHFVCGLDREVEQAIRAALDVYRSLGAEIQEISLPHSKYAVAVYYIVAPCEASSNLARYDGVRYGYRTPNPRSLDAMYLRTRDEGFGPEVKRRIMLGTYVLSAGYYDAYYLKAQQVRTLIRRDYETSFSTVDVVAMPTSPTPAFRLGEKTDDPLQMYLADVFTVPANLAGIPALQLPCAPAAGLPIGFQLLGRAFDEATLLRIGAAYQGATPHHQARPPIG